MTSSPQPESAADKTISILIDPGDASIEDVRAILRALNDLQVAAGGFGLEFRVDGLFVRARQEVSV